jgi:hypothetical protein
MLGKNGIKVFGPIFPEKLTLTFLGDHSLTPCIFRCYDITQLSHKSLVNCISDERQAKFTNPQILNVYGIVHLCRRTKIDSRILDKLTIY